MSIKIVVSNLVKFKVKGTIKDEAGTDQPFDFHLTCRRLDEDQIKTKLADNSETSVTDFMLEVIEQWQGVRDAEDKPMDFTEAAWRQLCKIRGVSLVAFRTYLAEVGAKEKN
ncbi:MAG: hypothetical protein INF98_16690 [Roseomonas sp.]|nr:hypothetical protein [Roseomonas sp.]